MSRGSLARALSFHALSKNRCGFSAAQRLVFKAERFESRTLLSTVVGDNGSADVFKPDPASLASVTHPNQVLIDITNLAALPSAWGITAASATPNHASDDDAPAFNAVLDFIGRQIVAYRNANGGNPMGGYNDPSTDYAIYVPAGQYDIKQPIRFTNATVEMAHLKILGQSRDGSTSDTQVLINATGNASNYTTTGFAMDLFTHDVGSTINNRPARDVFSNFNLQLSNSLIAAGVSGMQVVGANEFRMKNIRITGARSTSSNVFGLVVREPTAGFISNVTVTGFGTGVSLQGYQLISTDLGNVTVSSQGVAGIESDGGQPTIENLLSTQSRNDTNSSIPSAIIADKAAAVTVIGGSFTTTGSTSGLTSTAMVTHAANSSYSASSITALNVDIAAAYANKLTFNNVTQSDIQTGSLFSGVASHGATVDNPVDPNAISAVGAFNDYVRVDSPGGDDYGPGTVPHPNSATDLTWLTITGDAGATLGGTDSTLIPAEIDAIQAKINSYSPTTLLGLNFTNRDFDVQKSLNIPANVMVVDFGYGFVNNNIAGSGTNTAPFLKITGGDTNSAPLVISNITLFSSHAAGTQSLVSLPLTRPVAFDSVAVDSQITAIQDLPTTSVSTIYLQNTGGFLRSGLTDTPLKATRIYARGINSEGADRVAFGRLGHNAQLYVAGFKTEDDNINFEVTDNARLFVFGGASSQQGVDPASTNPILLVDNITTGAQVFLSISTYRQLGGDSGPQRSIVVQTPDAAQDLFATDNGIPQRSRPGQTSYDYIVPYLTIGFDSISGNEVMRWKDFTRNLTI